MLAFAQRSVGEIIEKRIRKQGKNTEQSNKKMDQCVDQQWMAIRNLKDTLIVQPNFELISVPRNFKV